MPRRNSSTRTDRYAPVRERGLYLLSEIADVSPLEHWREHHAEQRRRIRSVHR